MNVNSFSLLFLFHFQQHSLHTHTRAHDECMRHWSVLAHAHSQRAQCTQGQLVTLFSSYLRVLQHLLWNKVFSCFLLHGAQNPIGNLVRIVELHANVLKTRTNSNQMISQFSSFHTLRFHSFCFFASYYSMFHFNWIWILYTRCIQISSYSFAYWVFSLLVGVTRVGLIVGQSFFNFDFFLFTKQNTITKQKSACGCVKLMQNPQTHGHARFFKQVSVGVKQCIKVLATMSPPIRRNHPENRKRFFSHTRFIWIFFFA